MNATIKVHQNRRGNTETIIRFENGCAVHIEGRFAKTFGPGARLIAKHGLSQFSAVADCLHAAISYVPDEQSQTRGER